MTSQQPDEQCADSPSDFDARQKRLRYLELWRELGIRPEPSDCDPADRDLLGKEGPDDLGELKARCLDARRLMNQALPTRALARDDDLVPLPSGIKGAGMGLFFRPSSPSSLLHEGEVLCYYCGHLHNFHSQKELKDTSYLMLVDGDLFVDPGPLPQIKARYINDPLNVRFVNCHLVAQAEELRCAIVASRDIRVGEELFFSYGDAYWDQRKFCGTIYGEQ